MCNIISNLERGSGPLCLVSSPKIEWIGDIELSSQFLLSIISFLSY